MIYLFDKDEKLFKIINKPALKTVLQKYALTTEQYVSDRLTVEMKSLDTDELEKVEYMAIQTIEDAHTFHYFYVAQKHTDQLTTLIGVQSGIEELRKTPVLDKRPKNAFAKNVINDLLKGTNWQVRFVGETTQRSTSFYYISVFEALKKVCKVWDLEMQFFVEMNGNKIGARYIDFKRKIGSAVGKRVVYGHNALQILQEVERTNLFTALIGRGKGEQVSSAEESDKKTDGYGRKITFENVVWDVTKGNPVNKPKGQRFVELPEMTKVYGIKNTDGSIRPKIGFVDFQEEEDPGILLERTYKALVDTARPQLTLKTTSAYLRGVKVGDTIRVVRHDKKLDYDTRIFEITFNRLNNESSDIKLGDRIGESNEAKAQTIAEKVVDDFVSNEFSDFVQKLPDFLPSPDGFNNNWYGTEDPTVKHPGKVLVNDIWFKPDPEHEGHKIMLRWTGEVWDEIVRSYDTEAILESIGGSFELFRKNLSNSVQVLTDQALEKAGASNLLAQEAKQIGFDAMARLEAFKDQTYITQSTLTGDVDLLKQTINSEVNQASEYRRTTTEALSRMTGQMNGFATKSEVAQGIDGLTQTFAKMKVGGRNFIRNYDFDGLLPFNNFGTSWNYERIQDAGAKSGYVLKATCTKGGNGGFHKVLFDLRSDEFQGKDMTWSWDMKSSRSITFNVMGFEAGGLKRNVPVSTEWERINHTFQVAFKELFSCVFYSFEWKVGDVVYIRDPQLEEGTIATTPRPAPEDGKDEILAARTEFQKTAEGLSTRMSAVETYVGQDGQRQETLQRYAREESARQVSAVREQISRDYVGKSTYQEDVRGIERKFEAITNPQNGSIATKIAQYKQTVDGQFASIASQVAGKANQTDFQRVQETSRLYERIIGNNDNSISNNIARMALTSQLFQVEVTKASASGRNLFLNSLFKRDLRERYSTYDLFDGKDQTQGQLALSIDTNEKFKGANTLKIVSTFNGKQSNQKATFTIGGDARLGTVDEMRNKSVRFSFWAKSTVNNTNFQARSGYRGSLQSVPISTDWKFYDIEFIRKENSNATSELILHIFTAATVWIAFPKIEIGTVATPFSEAPEDTDEAIRTVQSQLAGSWGVHNKNSVNEIIAGFNLAGRNAGIKAETIRLEGNTLADKLTAIDGYFKRLFVGEGTFATLNADVIRTNSITADKLVFNEALANRLVSNEIITSKLVASRAFVNALKTVTIDASQIVTGTLKGDRIYGGTIRGTEINGTTITGNSRITIGDNGFLRPTQEGGLQINVPETFNASKGIGVQLFGRNFGQIPKGMFIYNSPNWNGGNLIGESVADTLLTVKGLTSLCNLYRGQPMSGLPINSNFRYGDPVGNLYRISFIAWDPRHGQMFVNDGTDTDGTWWFKPDASSSDKRLKTNIQDTDFEATDFVKKLEFKKFDWKPDKFGYKKPYTHVGLIAQDVEKLDSSLVYSQGENLALDDFRLGNIALKAIQELSQRIETLERKLA